MTTENVCNFLQVSWKLQTKTKTRRFVKIKIVKLKIVFSDILKPVDTFQNTGWRILSFQSQDKVKGFKMLNQYFEGED